MIKYSFLFDSVILKERNQQFPNTRIYPDACEHHALENKSYYPKHDVQKVTKKLRYREFLLSLRETESKKGKQLFSVIYFLINKYTDQ